MQVLAVDCDVRQGALAKLFRLADSPGLTDILSGRARLTDAIVDTPIPNLKVLPAGACGAANPTELLNSRASTNLFDEIHESFHYVVVDTPSVQRSSDVAVIGALCGGVVMVVRMHRAASQVVKKSVRWLQSNNLHVMGCIAAACRPNDDRYADALEEAEE